MAEQQQPVHNAIEDRLQNLKAKAQELIEGEMIRQGGRVSPSLYLLEIVPVLALSDLTQLDDDDVQQLPPGILATLERASKELQRVHERLSLWLKLEAPVEPWQYLVDRKLPNRRQLFIKGRNMSVRDVIGKLKSNKWTAEATAKNLKLPVAAIEEAIQYAEQNSEILELDAAYARFMDHDTRSKGVTLNAAATLP